MNERLELESAGPEETAALGEVLGEVARAGDVIVFFAGLGAGKTTMTQGIARGLGAPDEVTSPTFILMQVYPGRLPLYHVDAYRLHGEQEALAIGLDEAIDGEGLCILEWAENISGLWPASRLEVEIVQTGPGQRRITLQGCGPAGEDYIRRIRTRLGKE